MKIIGIHVKNFRSIETFEIDNIENLTYLVGRNNAGKSNVLKAILTFFNNKISIEDFPKNDDKASCEIIITFKEMSQGIKELLKIECNNEEQLIIKKVFIGTSTPKIFINDKDISDFKPKTDSIKDFREKFHNNLPLYYYIPALRNLKDEETWKSTSLIKSLLEPLIKETSMSSESVDFYLEKIKELILKESKVLNYFSFGTILCSQ